MIESQCRLVS